MQQETDAQYSGPYGDGYDAACEHLAEEHESALATLRAQVETLTRERDEARGGRDFWKKQMNIEAEISRRRTRERDRACRIAARYNKERLAKREKVRRLVECVRKIHAWNEDCIGNPVRLGLHNILATVSDITAPTDEVQS
jgi:hypothetical protein